MNELQQFEDCFEVELNIKKVQNIFFLSPHQLLVLHIPQKYSIVDIIDRNQSKVIITSTFKHPITEQIQPLDSRSVVYIQQNCLHLFDLLAGTITSTYQIGKSDIYQEQFQFQMNHDQNGHQIVFYKTSILKSTPITIYYDIHLLSVSKVLEKIKRIKVEHEDLRQFGFCCGQLCSYQTAGYTIEVNFIESGINHKINSIFHLFLINVRLNRQELIFNFTHEELQNQLSCYSVNKKRVKKLERKDRALNAHTFYSHNELRSIVYKNCFNHRNKDHFSGIFRFKATKQSKYLKLLDHIVPETMGNNFKQDVLSLLC